MMLTTIGGLFIAENPLQSPVKLDPEIAERIQYNLDKGKKKADRDFLRKFILYRKTRMS